MEPRLLVSSTITPTGFVYDHPYFTSTFPFISFNIFSPILLRFVHTLFDTLDLIGLNSFLHLYLIHVQYSRNGGFLDSCGLLRTNYLRSFIRLWAPCSPKLPHRPRNLTPRSPLPWPAASRLTTTLLSSPYPMNRSSTAKTFSPSEMLFSCMGR
ncbi:hypothetical protein L218DRAFT_542331 [Marasmius fiardii PR-910]|nr:hypothetical protein L218DRAFT_542331 [Marasmius fiardii PR-910]